LKAEGLDLFDIIEDTGSVIKLHTRSHDGYGFTKRLDIIFKNCILNHTGEDLAFFMNAEDAISTPSFIIPLNEGTEVSLFRKAQRLQIRGDPDRALVSEILNLEKTGLFPVDLTHPSRKHLNFMIQVESKYIGKKILNSHFFR
jgi:hypothetical protein